MNGLDRAVIFVTGWFRSCSFSLGKKMQKSKATI